MKSKSKIISYLLIPAMCIGASALGTADAAGKRQFPDTAFDGGGKRQFPDTAFDGGGKRQFPDSTFDSGASGKTHLKAKKAFGGKRRFPDSSFDGDASGKTHLKAKKAFDGKKGMLNRGKPGGAAIPTDPNTFDGRRGAGHDPMSNRRRR